MANGVQFNSVNGEKCENITILTQTHPTSFDITLWLRATSTCTKHKNENINERGPCQSKSSKSTFTRTVCTCSMFFSIRRRLLLKYQCRVQFLHFSHAIRPGIVIYAAFALHFYFKGERKQRENVQIVNAFTPVWLLLLLLEWLAVCCESSEAYSHTVFYASS